MKNLIFCIENFMIKNKVFIFPAFISSIVFFIIFGVEVLNPCNTDLVLMGGDLTQHYLGWQYYRNADWQFPIGLMNNCMHPFNTSIIFTDSIPLLAVLLKPFSALLPEKFQYLGFYAFSSFVLQGVLAAAIIKKYIKDDVEVIILSVFFIFMPVVFPRILAHTALASMWLVLLGLIVVIYKDKMFYNLKRSVLIWAFIGFLCSSIHIYYVPMLGIVAVGFACKEFKISKKSSKNTFSKIINVFAPLIAYILSSLLFVYLWGGFSEELGEKVKSVGFSFFSFNINSFFNSLGASDVLPELPIKMPQRFESFSYLGLGVLILFFISFVLFLKNYNFKKFFKNHLFDENENLLPFTIISVLSLFASLSNNISFGSKNILKYPIPEFVENLWSNFRATGRFIWPCMCIIFIFALCYLRKYFIKKTFLVLITLCLFVQVYDLHSFIYKYYEKFTIAEHNCMFNDKRWESLLQNGKIKHIIISKNIDMLPNLTAIYDIAEFATNNKLTTNIYYIAHLDNEKSDKIDKVFDEAINAPTDDTLFLFLKSQKEEIENENYNLFFYEIGEFIVGYKNKLDI